MHIELYSMVVASPTTVLRIHTSRTTNLIPKTRLSTKGEQRQMHIKVKVRLPSYLA